MNNYFNHVKKWGGVVVALFHKTLFFILISGSFLFISEAKASQYDECKNNYKIIVK